MSGSTVFLCVVGEVGDWKNLFTETQNQEMDEKFKERLAGTSLGAKLKYESYCQAWFWSVQQAWIFYFP